MARTRAVVTDEVRELVLLDWEYTTITHKALAQRYGTSPSTIRNILRGKTKKLGHSGAYSSPAAELSEKACVASHGMSADPAYVNWWCMIARCYYKTVRSYPWYGGRGIRVCERWHLFENFRRDIGPKPGPNYTVEREDPDKDYQPGNCKWLPRIENKPRAKGTLGISGSG